MKKSIVAMVLAALTLTGIGVGVAAGASSIRSAATCGSNLLTWFAPQGSGYTGGIGYAVEFSNIGTSTCTVSGYPTAKLTKNGARVGEKSTHDPLVHVKTITLKPGQTAHVVLFLVDAGALCSHPKTTTGLTVRAPGTSRGVSFALDGAACTGRSTLRVDAVNPGTGVPGYTPR